MSELKEEQNFATEQLKDAINADETGAPKANVESDYSRSKEFSTPSSSASSTEVFDSINSASAFSNQAEGSKGSEAGNPGSFINMAKEVNPDSQE